MPLTNDDDPRIVTERPAGLLLTWMLGSLDCSTRSIGSPGFRSMSPAVTVDGVGSSLLLLLPDAHAATSATIVAGSAARDGDCQERKDRMRGGGNAAGRRGKHVSGELSGAVPSMIGYTRASCKGPTIPDASARQKSG